MGSVSPARRGVAILDAIMMIRRQNLAETDSANTREFFIQCLLMKGCRILGKRNLIVERAG
jgi:hypothetical protein